MSGTAARCARSVLGRSLALWSVVASPAFAHGGLGDAAPFWSGALHIFLTPMAVAVAVGLGAAMARAPLEQNFKAAGPAAVACAVVGFCLPGGSGLLSAVGGIVTGVSAACGFRPGNVGVLLAAAGVTAGASVGAAVELDDPGLVAATGAGVALFLSLFYLHLALGTVAKRWPIALRIVGAWIAAISLLLGALALADK